MQSEEIDRDTSSPGGNVDVFLCHIGPCKMWGYRINYYYWGIQLVGYFLALFNANNSKLLKLKMVTDLDIICNKKIVNYFMQQRL